MAVPELPIDQWSCSKEITLRMASQEDYEYFLELSKEFWNLVEPPTVSAWNETLVEKTYFLNFKGTEGHSDCGFIRFKLHAGNCHVFNLFVASEYRRKGIASAVLVALRDLLGLMKFRSWTINVREESVPAYSLYSSLGFEKIVSSGTVKYKPSYGHHSDLENFIISKDLVPEGMLKDISESHPIYGLLDEHQQVMAAFQLQEYNYSKGSDQVRPFYLKDSNQLPKVLAILPSDKIYVIRLESYLLPFDQVKQKLVDECNCLLQMETIAMKQGL